jgi:shikimate kinase
MRLKPMHRRIFVVGMPGSGKTTEGKKLASKLAWQFVDLDKKIEQEVGSDIPNIFAEKGEPFFRELEQKLLLELAQIDNVVIACGGGTVAFHNNMQWIKKSGFSIYLRAEPKLLLSRILASKSKRPLFEGLMEAEILEKIKSLLQIRMPFFEQADCTIALPNEAANLMYSKALEVFEENETSQKNDQS